MKTAARLLVFVALLTLPLAAAPRTPEKGSPERVAICDALRKYLAEKVATRPLPQPIVFKIEYLRVDDGYAWFEGFPQFTNGGDPFEYLPDIDYNFVLKGGGRVWTVRNDLSRSDVPSEEEVMDLRKELARVPTSIMPEFWRKTLKR